MSVSAAPKSVVLYCGIEHKLPSPLTDASKLAVLNSVYGSILSKIFSCHGKTLSVDIPTVKGGSVLCYFDCGVTTDDANQAFLRSLLCGHLLREVFETHDFSCSISTIAIVWGYLRTSVHVVRGDCITQLRDMGFLEQSEKCELYISNSAWQNFSYACKTFCTGQLTFNNSFVVDGVVDDLLPAVQSHIRQMNRASPSPWSLLHRSPFPSTRQILWESMTVVYISLSSPLSSTHLHEDDHQITAVHAALNDFHGAIHYTAADLTGLIIVIASFTAAALLPNSGSMSDYDLSAKPMSGFSQDAMDEQSFSMGKGLGSFGGSHLAHLYMHNINHNRSKGKFGPVSSETASTDSSVSVQALLCIDYVSGCSGSTSSCRDSRGAVQSWGTKWTTFQCRVGKRKCPTGIHRIG